MKIFAAAFSVLLSFNAYAVCPLPDKTVSIEAKGAAVKDLLKFILDQSGLTYDINSLPKTSKTVSLEVKNGKICDVYEFLMEQGNYEQVLKIQTK
ncbi:MAG: hypothetical protein SGJ18_02800 [Pseudomonadota bacterium]|nr:hypothetical protein [Pseudomonadota bacterium]